MIVEKQQKAYLVFDWKITKNTKTMNMCAKMLQTVD